MTIPHLTPEAELATAFNDIIMEKLIKKGIKKFFEHKKYCQTYQLHEGQSYTDEDVWDYMLNRMHSDLEQANINDEHEDRKEHFFDLLEQICTSEFYDTHYTDALNYARECQIESEQERRYQQAHMPTWTP
jgi:hypothetical protein